MSTTNTTQRLVLSNDLESTCKSRIQNDSDTISDINPLQSKIQEIFNTLSNKVPTNLFVNNNQIAINDGIATDGTIRIMHSSDGAMAVDIESSLVNLEVNAQQYNDLFNPIQDSNPLQLQLNTNSAQISYNDDVVDSNTIRIVQANDIPISIDAGTNLNTSALALESGGNLDSIDTNYSSLLSSTNLMRTDFGDIKTSYVSINGKKPALGQTIESGSVPVVLSNDYLSTVMEKNYFEENCEHDVALFQLNSSYNLAQNVASATNSTLPDFPSSGIVYIDKINLKLSIDGITDAEAWGSTNVPLNNGWTLTYLPNSSTSVRYLTALGSTVLSMADIRFLCDDNALHLFGGGEEVFLASRRFDPMLKIDLDNGGYIRIGFGIDDYSSGQVLEWYFSVSYYT